MNAPCPRGTSWCLEHEHDADQCISTPLTVAAGCSVWLMQELPGLEPTVVVDIADGADLSIPEATDLAQALGTLRDLTATGARS